MYSRLVCIPIILILFCIPVLADPVTIPLGGEVYLGEEGLDIHLAVPYPYTSIAYYAAGSSPGRDQPLDIMQVSQNRFSVIADLFYDKTGAWYQWDPVRGMPGQVAFIVRNPRISLKVMDRNTMSDRSYGTASKGTPLVIQVETNLAGITRRPDFGYYDGPLKIQIMTPGGGTLSGVVTPGGGQYQFSSFIPTGELGYAPPIESGGWDTGWSGYESGLYRIEPQFAVNRMDDNLRSYSGRYTLRGTEVTLGTERAGLHATTDRVVRGDPFGVTITGSPGTPYVVWVEGGSGSGRSGDQPPMILSSQEGVRQDRPDGPFTIGSYRPYGKDRTLKEIVPGYPYSGVYYYAEVNPDRNGRRTVEFRTSQETDDRRYTIHIEGPVGAANPKYDKIQVEVVKGSVSLTTGADTFTIGEEIRLRGVNTGSCDTYLFITGPNLPSAGGRLDAPRRAVVNGNPSSFTMADSDCETWDYRLYTGNLGLDAGTYTIYAVSTPSDRYHLDRTTWETIPITLTRPYISVSSRRMTVAQGDELTITGSSGGNPDAGVAIWIFGRNFFWYDTASVERGGYFSYDLSRAMTSDMAPGEYSVIVQHPMADGEFNLWPDRNREVVLGTTPWWGAPVFRVGGPGALQGPAAASALINALSSQFIDDTYTEYSIFIQNPKIGIDRESLTGTIDTPIIISGTTNIAPDSKILIEVTDEQFGPTQKGSSGEWAGYSGTTTTFAGPAGEQEYLFEIPAGTLPASTYQVLIQAVSSPGTASGVLTVEYPVVETITPTVVTPKITLNNTTTPTISITPVITAEIVNETIQITHTQTPASIDVPYKDIVNIQELMNRSREPPVLLGLGITLGLLLAGLVVVLYSWQQRKKETETKEPEETDNQEKITNEDAPVQPQADESQDES
ncbi:DUF3821 domain-containing protein [Methanospirillum sp. J.3.6.1-F.2.7.3]|uniref:DUF3821 domain-containing protein n=1 Tax=Methanospirillum purgamenti TaxID=2834276 RepID=A0A8E7B2X6_9EURY|nr:MULTISPECIES: DUF3821 domain-containing protein [Methanospirillum]MDX8549842.1 DUF3821 domain-containing protein [Methanospirillum hungatei]QVV89523.1 DUF3821 domain-containing protein [Methanospirillum sp. J.3.6.1-F.2.7.3]